MTVKLARNCITSRLFGSNWEITGKFSKDREEVFHRCSDQAHYLDAEQLGDEQSSIDLPPKKTKRETGFQSGLLGGWEGYVVIGIISF